MVWNLFALQKRKHHKTIWNNVLTWYLILFDRIFHLCERSLTRKTAICLFNIRKISQRRCLFHPSTEQQGQYTVFCTANIDRLWFFSVSRAPWGSDLLISFLWYEYGTRLTHDRSDVARLQYSFTITNKMTFFMWSNLPASPMNYTRTVLFILRSTSIGAATLNALSKDYYFLEVFDNALWVRFSCCYNKSHLD